MRCYTALLQMLKVHLSTHIMNQQHLHWCFGAMLPQVAAQVTKGAQGSISLGAFGARRWASLIEY